MSVTAPLLLLLSVGALGQFPGPGQIGGWGGQQNGPGGRPGPIPNYGKPPPNRPSGPFGLNIPGVSSFTSSHQNQAQYDDPIPQISQSDASYDTQTLPAKLPIQAPNGVVEIYNRVVDDLIRRLEMDFKKREIDPMPIVIRPTPAGPVRVPGYMQRRPFRRPGAALYRSDNSPPSMTPNHLLKKKKIARDLEVERFPAIAEDKATPRGAGKISKGPLDPNEEIPETTTPENSTVPPAVVTEQINVSKDESSEEGLHIPLFRARSEEDFNDDTDDEDINVKPPVPNKAKTDNESPEDVDGESESPKVKSAGPPEVKVKVDSLTHRYSNKNQKAKSKYSGTTKKAAKEKKKPEKSKEEVDDDEDDDKDDKERDIVEDDDRDENLDFHEPGTQLGSRPPGGYYPQGGPPAIPTKPNAILTGLSKITRSSDVTVSVDARSAQITARLLVGPLNVLINDSVEPLEKNVKATIPELEAELLLMERHGVVFLQRFTLDRAYGQDVEISIPKGKGDKKKKGNKGNVPLDPNHPLHPAAQSRYQTKMAAHISMEVVKLLRSGNLRVNLMRTAQSSMSKLKLPIQKQKSKSKKNKKKQQEEES